MKNSIDRIHEITVNFHALLKLQAGMFELENLVISSDSEGHIRIDTSNDTREEFYNKIIHEIIGPEDRWLSFTEAVLALVEMEKNLRRD